MSVCLNIYSQSEIYAAGAPRLLLALALLALLSQVLICQYTGGYL